MNTYKAIILGRKVRLTYNYYPKREYSSRFKPSFFENMIAKNNEDIEDVIIEECFLPFPVLKKDDDIFITSKDKISTIRQVVLDTNGDYRVYTNCIVEEIKDEKTEATRLLAKCEFEKANTTTEESSIKKKSWWKF